VTAPARPAAGGAGVTLESLREAQAALRGIARRTPLVESPALSRETGVPVFLKAEQLQPVGAFKVRGAYTAIRRLSAEARSRGVVTHSSGNHGFAVAWAARRLGVPAVVVMPADAPRVKLDAVRAQGAELVEVPDRALRQRTAERLMRERGLAFIPPYDHPDVIAGQGTCGLEILEQCRTVATILVPVSGGGFVSGIATAVRALRPETRVIGVEPEGAAKLTAALRAGEPVALDRPSSIADGLLAPSVGSLPFQQMAGVVREAWQVSEAALGAAVRFLWEAQGWRVEPSGAAAVAALRTPPPGGAPVAGPVVAVVSGGNVDPELFDRLVPD
jgi:threonine dehydratase